MKTHERLMLSSRIARAGRVGIGPVMPEALVTAERGAVRAFPSEIIVAGKRLCTGIVCGFWCPGNPPNPLNPDAATLNLVCISQFYDN